MSTPTSEKCHICGDDPVFMQFCSAPHTQRTSKDVVDLLYKAIEKYGKDGNSVRSGLVGLLVFAHEEIKSLRRERETLAKLGHSLMTGGPSDETCDALTEAHCYEGEKDYQLDQLLDYLHYDPDTRSHPDWVARAQAAEAELNKARRCVGCGGTLVLPDRCDDCSSQKANERPKCSGTMGCHVHWSGWPTHHPNCSDHPNNRSVSEGDQRG